MSLMDKIDSLRMPEEDSMQGMMDACARMLSETQMQLRTAQHERLMAEERLSAANARSIAAEERAAREAQSRAALEDQLKMLREQSAEVYNQLATERGTRMDVDAELIQVRGERKRLQDAAKQTVDDGNRAVLQMLDRIERMLLNSATQSGPASYTFDIQRDRAGRTHRIVAKPDNIRP